MLEEMVKEGADIICPKPYPSARLPGHIVEAVERAAKETVNPPSRGLPEFREAVAGVLSHELSISVDPERQVLATSGGMHALYIIFSTLLNEGDSVLVPSPCYFLEGIIEPLGASIVEVPMREEDNYAWDFGLLERKVNEKTKLVFLNTPVNPTGYVLTTEDLEQLAKIANEHNLLIVADESYDKLVYDGLHHHSIASLARMRNRTILVRSFTKSYAMPHYRVGYIVAPPELIESFTETLEWMMLFGNYVSQKAATAALLGPQDWLEGAFHEFATNRELVCEGINKIPEISCIKPLGGPFIFPNVCRLRGGCKEISDVLLRKFGIPSVPGTYFRSDHHIRIAFGGPESLIKRLSTRLKLAVDHIGFE